MFDRLRTQFLEPDDEFTVFPLWLWNDDLHEDEIARQIRDFKSKGIDAFIIHPTIGIPRSIPHMPDRLLELVKFAVEEAVKLDMKVGICDEAISSGSADGLVVKGNPEYASRGLKMSELPTGAVIALEAGEIFVTSEDGKAINGGNSTLAKSSSDSARHAGKRRNSNKVFGCDSRIGANQWAMDANDVKWYLDWLLVRGVNMIIPHAFFYSADGDIRRWDRLPCVGPKNTWWPYYSKIADYIKRMSWLMTDSVNFTGVAILCSGDRLPWGIAKILYQNQIEFNYLEQDVLLKDSIIRKGRIKVRAQSYNIVIVEETNMVNGDVAKVLAAFAKSRGKIVTLKSEGMPAVCEKGIIIENADEILTVLKNAEAIDVVTTPNAPDLRVSHVVRNKKHFFLLVNEGEEKIKCSLSLRKVGRAERWDAWSGNTAEISAYAKKGKSMLFDLELGRRESVIFAVDPSDRPNINRKPDEFGEIYRSNMSKGWKFTDDTGKETDMTVFTDWTEIEGLKEFAGTLAYRTQFIIIEKGDKVVLDLGEVREIAAIEINDRDAGLRMWSPYEFDITEYVMKGGNSLTVYLTNSVANKAGRGMFKAGLFGPVMLTVYNKTRCVQIRQQET